MPEELCLRRNIGPWDRGIRLAFAAVIVLAGPQLLRNPFALIAAGAVCGFALLAAFQGY